MQLPATPTHRPRCRARMPMTFAAIAPFWQRGISAAPACDDEYRPSTHCSLAAIMADSPSGFVIRRSVVHAELNVRATGVPPRVASNANYSSPATVVRRVGYHLRHGFPFAK